MKTLTLLETFIKLSEKLYVAKVKRDTATLLSNIARHCVEVLAIQGKLNRCKVLLTKRLQEQEEELELMRMYYGEEAETKGDELHIYVATDKGED